MAAAFDKLRQPWQATAAPASNRCLSLSKAASASDRSLRQAQAAVFAQITPAKMVGCTSLVGAKWFP